MGRFKTLKRALIPLAPLLLLFALTPTPIAIAHAQLIESSIKDGANLAAFPEVITLTFNEELIKLETKRGEGAVQVSIEEKLQGEIDLLVDILGAKLVITPTPQTSINSNSKSAEYLLKYRVVSRDGHVISGELSFSVSGSVSGSNPVPEADLVNKEESAPLSSLLLVALIVLALSAATALLIQSGNRDSV
jgi:methionine-rich copper-binding protein CopC